ncbi:hypothetical protein KY330_03625 [Candidatus Woesearchaeota archaeon]|nr:hypothetical protein [Candidatus Woesearchaeota archaeon]
MQSQRMILKAEAILRYFLGTSDKIETLVMCKPNDIDLVCYDQSLYEAIGSLKPEEKEELQKKLTKFLESVEIISFKNNLKKTRQILKQERVIELRKLAGAQLER